MQLGGARKRPFAASQDSPAPQTIADFRRNNGKAMRNVCSQFVGSRSGTRRTRIADEGALLDETEGALTKHIAGTMADDVAYAVGSVDRMHDRDDLPRLDELVQLDLMRDYARNRRDVLVLARYIEMDAACGLLSDRPAAQHAIGAQAAHQTIEHQLKLGSRQAPSSAFDLDRRNVRGQRRVWW